MDYYEFRQFVEQAHGDQVDKIGEPYVGHLNRVSYYAATFAFAYGFSKEDVKTVRWIAIGHDAIEDTAITESKLREIVPKEIADAIAILTDNKDQDHFERISGIIATGNRLAILVKMADAMDNKSPARLKKLEENRRKIYEKRYGEAFNRLQKALMRLLLEDE